MRTVLSSLSMILPALLSAGARAAPADPVLEITPEVCVRSDATQPCAMRLRFSWHLNQPTPVCLFQQSQERPLYCANANENTYSRDAELDNDTQFELRHATSGLALAINNVEVATVIEQLRPRRRFGWGLF